MGGGVRKALPRVLRCILRGYRFFDGGDAATLFHGEQQGAVQKCRGAAEGGGVSANIAGVKDKPSLTADVAGQERFDAVHLIEIAIKAVGAKQIEVGDLFVDSAAWPAGAGHLRSESSLAPERDVVVGIGEVGGIVTGQFAEKFTGFENFELKDRQRKSPAGEMAKGLAAKLMTVGQKRIDVVKGELIAEAIGRVDKPRSGIEGAVDTEAFQDSSPGGICGPGEAVEAE